MKPDRQRKGASPPEERHAGRHARRTDRGAEHEAREIAETRARIAHAEDARWAAAAERDRVRGEIRSL